VPKLRNQGLLIELMKTWDLSIRSLASHASISKSTVSHLTSGARAECSLPVASAIAKELQVPIHTLFVMPANSNESGKSDSLVDTDWVAQRLGMTTEWVREQATAGRLPAARIGQQYRFRPSDIARFEEQAFARASPPRKLAPTG
jgi:excisionase family DNA binding protein